MEQIQYIKGDKAYKVQKKAWRPRKVRLWLIVPLVLLLVLGGWVVLSAVTIETTGQTTYDVKGEIDYQVYLKENDYYTEKFLGQGRQYIASLINIVRADFDYKLEADDALNAYYEYEIVATAKATEKNDKTKVLYEKAETLKTGDLQNMEQGEIALRESVDVDYGRYNDLMRSFRQDFGISADCFLDLELVVKVDGAIKTEDILAINIPLSDQTIDIAMDTTTVTRQETVGEAVSSLQLKNLPMLIVGAVIMLVSLIMVIIIVYYYATRYDDNLYEKALHKILKEYDTYIVTATETIYELPAVMRVESFKELLDASQAENAPIVFLEVVPGEKSYFVVNGANTTYRYTLTKAYQDHLAANGEREY